MKYNSILVLGGSGETGKWVLQLAIERGHRLTALVRSKENIDQRDGLELVQGDVLDAAALERVVEGKSAVISCLGIRRKTASNPWSPLLSAVDFTERSAQNIAKAMKKHDVSRLIAISAAGAGDSHDHVGAIVGLMIRNSNLAITLRDSSRMEEIYEKSGLDSMVVRPARLVDWAANRSGRTSCTGRCPCQDFKKRCRRLDAGCA